MFPLNVEAEHVPLVANVADDVVLAEPSYFWIVFPDPKIHHAEEARFWNGYSIGKLFIRTLFAPASAEM